MSIDLDPWVEQRYGTAKAERERAGLIHAIAWLVSIGELPVRILDGIENRTLGDLRGIVETYEIKASTNGNFSEHYVEVVHASPRDLHGLRELAIGLDLPPDALAGTVWHNQHWYRGTFSDERLYCSMASSFTAARTIYVNPTWEGGPLLWAYEREEFLSLVREAVLDEGIVKDHGVAGGTIDKGTYAVYIARPAIQLLLRDGDWVDARLA